MIVLEKGGYSNEANFTLQEAQARPKLYLKRGKLTSKGLVDTDSTRLMLNPQWNRPGGQHPRGGTILCHCQNAFTLTPPTLLEK